MATANQLVAKAASQVGTTEIGYTNKVEFNDWFYGGRSKYGSWAAWCAAFTSWACAQVGMQANIDYPHTAGVAVARAWAKQHGRWVSASQIRKGDLVVFLPHFSHIAIARADAAGGSVKTIEGNTSPGNSGSQRDGGGVWNRTRPLSLVGGGIRLNFTSTAPAEAKPAAPPEPKGVLGMTKRINHYRNKAQKATGTRHLMINDKGDYTIVAGPAEAVISAKVDIGGLKAGQHGFLILAEVMYKKGQPTVISREIATVKVTSNTVWSVAGAWTLPKTHNGKSPRLRLIFKTSSKTATAHNVYISGVRD